MLTDRKEKNMQVISRVIYIFFQLKARKSDAPALHTVPDPPPGFWCRQTCALFIYTLALAISCGFPGSYFQHITVV